MKFEDIKKGQIVVDIIGNEYEVIDIDNEYHWVKLKCIKFVAQSYVDTVFSFNNVGHDLWVRLNSDDFKNRRFKPHVTVETLKLKKVN